MRHIVSFSGGKDSTAMLFMMLEKGLKIDQIVFVDTSKEFPQMYEHIELVKGMIKPLEITTVKIDFDYWFSEHVKTKGSFKGTKGYGWPDHQNRWCTGKKATAFRRTVYGDKPHRPGVMQRTVCNYANTVEYRGIAGDELSRVKYYPEIRINYPLVAWGITQKDSLEYCKSLGFTWGGLYEKFSRVSCYLCPLQGIESCKVLYQTHPELWEVMRQMDKKSFRQYHPRYSLSELEERFNNEFREYEAIIHKAKEDMVNV